MVFKRVFRKRRFVRRRKLFGRRRFRKVKNMSPEFKYNDINNNSAITPAGVFSLMNGLVQGTSAVTRIGQRIIIRSILLNILLYGQPVQPYSMLRFMIIQDKQPNGAIFTLGSLLENPAAGSSTLSPLNYDNTKRYKILWDKRFVLCNSANQEKFIKYYKKVYIPVEYNVFNAGTVADINKNSLYLLVINSDNINVPSFSWYHRIRYTDS